MSVAALFLTVLLACAVEAVEALTVVLAVGTTRGWRSASQGTAAALVGLAAVVAVLGPAVSAIPLNALRLVVGTLLLLFGLQWLRKAVLRAAGLKALHDEEAAFARQTAAAARAEAGGRGRVHDWYAFTLAFKAVLLEGLEVVFIVVTFGGSQHDVPVAAVAALCAVAVVATAGVAVRAPLSRVPENTMKFAVSVMLTGFGLFWSTEGTGADWPGGDLALLVLLPSVALLALAGAALLRRRAARRAAARRAAARRPEPAPAAGGAPATGAPTQAPAPQRPGTAGRLRSALASVYDFVVGDDWRTALGVVAALAATAGFAHGFDGGDWRRVLPVLPVLAVIVFTADALLRAARAARPA